MTQQKTTAEEHREQLLKFVTEFEDQFGVVATATGHEMTASENGGVYSKEFLVDDLIETPIDDLRFTVGGWFEMDTREEEPAVYCHLAVKLNGDRFGDGHQALKCRYHHDEGEWGEIRWATL